MSLPKFPKGEGNKNVESYLECLGYEMGIEFQPKSGLKVVQSQTSDKEEEEGSSATKNDSVLSHDLEKDMSLSSKKAKSWISGKMTSAFTKNAMTVKQDIGKKKSTWADFLVEDENVPQGNALKRSGVTAPKATQPRSSAPLKTSPKVTSSSYLNSSSKPISNTPSTTFTSNVASNKTCYQVKRPNSGPSLFTTYEANRQAEPVKKLRMDNKASAPQLVQKGPPANQVNARPNSANFMPPPTTKLASMESLYDTSSFLKPVPPGSSATSAAQALWNPHILSSASKANSTNTNEETKKSETEKNEKQNESKSTGFQSAYDKLIAEDKKNGINRNLPPPSSGKVSGVSGLFKSNKSNANNNPTTNTLKQQRKPEDEDSPTIDNPEVAELMTHEKMKAFEPKIVEAILSEVMEEQQATDWDDIAGLEGPKAVIKEIIIWPMLRPDIFQGLRASPKGILLFGPPGTGKTMIGRLIATQSSSTFFNISASSLTSKWIGDGEKMVRCLFQVARIKQPAVIFIDEIDSILTQRSDTEHESSRRLKTEFLIQFDGAGTKQDDKILVIGVTNRPQELDEAARRRLVKRIYIPLPDIEGRRQIVQNLLRDQKCNLSKIEIQKIAEMSEGYSGADMRSLCQEASYGPIRDIGHNLANVIAEDVRPIQLKDFISAMKRVKSSVALKDLSSYEEWDKSFGCHIDN